MKKINTLIILALVFITANIAKAQTFTGEPEIVIDDTLKKPVIAIYPDDMEIEVKDSARFIVQEVSFYNEGGGILYINYIDGACGCSTSKLLNNNISPTGEGKMILSINLEGVSENNNLVEYLVYSNASNTPVPVRIKVIDNRVIKNHKKCDPKNVKEK